MGMGAALQKWGRRLQHRRRSCSSPLLSPFNAAGPCDYFYNEQNNGLFWYGTSAHPAPCTDREVQLCEAVARNRKPKARTTLFVRRMRAQRDREEPYAISRGVRFRTTRRRMTAARRRAPSPLALRTSSRPCPASRLGSSGRVLTAARTAGRRPCTRRSLSARADARHARGAALGVWSAVAHARRGLRTERSSPCGQPSERAPRDSPLRGPAAVVHRPSDRRRRVSAANGCYWA